MSHQNIVNAMLSYTDVGPLYKNDVYVAFLPLAHVLEFISGSYKLVFLPFNKELIDLTLFCLQKAYGCCLEFQLDIRLL